MKPLWLMCVSATILLTGMSWYYLIASKLTIPAIKQDAQIIKAYASRVIDSPNYQDKPPKTLLSYEDAQRRINQDRTALAQAYKKATNLKEKQAVLNKARQHFIKATTTLLPYWYGTEWDFNGTSQTPQQGKIACGYYVSTVLEDAGLAIERNKLAQQASETIIKSLTDEAHIKRFSNRPLDEFVQVVNDWCEGLYIVGLDFHVGYLWHDGEHVHFIHSTVMPPRSVLSEPANTSQILAHSKYRVVGKISDDDALIKKWLLQTSIPTNH